MDAARLYHKRNGDSMELADETRFFIELKCGGPQNRVLPSALRRLALWFVLTLDKA